MHIPEINENSLKLSRDFMKSELITSHICCFEMIPVLLGVKHWENQSWAPCLLAVLGVDSLVLIKAVVTIIELIVEKLITSPMKLIAYAVTFVLIKKIIKEIINK